MRTNESPIQLGHVSRRTRSVQLHVTRHNHSSVEFGRFWLPTTAVMTLLGDFESLSARSLDDDQLIDDVLYRELEAGQP